MIDVEFKKIAIISATIVAILSVSFTPVLAATGDDFVLNLGSSSSSSQWQILDNGNTNQGYFINDSPIAPNPYPVVDWTVDYPYQNTSLNIVPVGTVVKAYAMYDADTDTVVYEPLDALNKLQQNWTTAYLTKGQNYGVTVDGGDGSYLDPYVVNYTNAYYFYTQLPYTGFTFDTSNRTWSAFRSNFLASQTGQTMNGYFDINNIEKLASHIKSESGGQICYQKFVLNKKKKYYLYIGAVPFFFLSTGLTDYPSFDTQNGYYINSNGKFTTDHVFACVMFYAMYSGGTNGSKASLMLPTADLIDCQFGYPNGNGGYNYSSNSAKTPGQIGYSINAISRASSNQGNSSYGEYSLTVSKWLPIGYTWADISLGMNEPSQWLSINDFTIKFNFNVNAELIDFNKLTGGEYVKSGNSMYMEYKFNPAQFISYSNYIKEKVSSSGGLFATYYKYTGDSYDTDVSIMVSDLANLDSSMLDFDIAEFENSNINIAVNQIKDFDQSIIDANDKFRLSIVFTLLLTIFAIVFL